MTEIGMALTVLAMIPMAMTLPATTLPAQAFEKLRCSAMIVYIVASREPIDDLGDEGERALGPFVRSVAALANLAFEEHGDAPASRFPAGGVCEGLAFEPRGDNRFTFGVKRMMI